MREIVLEAPRVRSLVWRGDELVDWASGGVVYRLDGTSSPARVNYAYRFDAAIASPSGRLAVIYERRGTKALVLRDGEVVRELNRSFYHADAYDYPVALFALEDGREALAHCPSEYSKIEIEEAESGRALTSREGEAADFFHSRLAASPDGRRLLSAGWIWHPFDAVALFDVRRALAEPSHLDEAASLPHRQPDSGGVEVSSAAWLDSNRVLLTSARAAEDFLEGDEDEDERGTGRFVPGSVAVWDCAAKAFESVAPLAEGKDEIGTMMSFGAHHAVGFYGHPKLFEARTGRVLFRWAHLESGQQLSSITRHIPAPPPLAMDAVNGRFALVRRSQIVVIEL